LERRLRGKLELAAVGAAASANDKDPRTITMENRESIGRLDHRVQV
jgi:hypothetical protein